MITQQQFRANFPEFSSNLTYPASQVVFWLDTAYMMLNARVWGRQIDIGAQMYAAHNLAIGARAVLDAGSGGIAGGQGGPISSKSVDKVAVGYDTGVGAEAGGGQWNLTVYGTRFYRLAKMFGAAPIQIGGGAGGGGGWPGPDTTPGFSNF